MKHSSMTSLWSIGAIAFTTLLVTPFFGVQTMNPVEALSDDQLRYIFLSIRIPRTIAGFFAGAGLALSGLVYQALFRNPLASPFTLGVSGGASLGAGSAIAFGLGGSVLGLSLTSLGAFIGALVAMMLVYAFAQMRNGTTTSLLLAGVIIGTLSSSAIMFLHYLSPMRHSFLIMRWLMGGLASVTVSSLYLMVPLAALAIAVLLLWVPKLDQFMTGEDIAQTRGVNTLASRNILLAATALLIGAIVAVCGPIAFVGIMAPHACRMLLRTSRHGRLAAASLLLGGSFLVISDTIGRVLAAPSELPVGVITSLCGGPFFLFILFRRNYRGYF